jgi:hypothetical protein
MELPLKKEWRDNRELAQTVGKDSCFVFKEGNKIISACNKQGKISVRKINLE